jgi:hypothetical protein
MTTRAIRCAARCALVVVITVLISCSSETAPPKMGTPAFYWSAARETWAQGDYVKTEEHLDKLLAAPNEYTARALPWSLVLTSGMASGYRELAEHFANGARMNRSDPGSFRRLVSRYRALASRLAMQSAENFGKLGQIKDDSIALAFGFPKGTAAAVPVLTKVSNGIQLPAADLESAQARIVERGVILAACRAAGAPDDAARTESILKGGDAKVPRTTFLLAIAQELYSQSQLYTSDRMDEPQKIEIFCRRAQDALKDVPESKERKALDAKIQSALKKPPNRAAAVRQRLAGTSPNSEQEY